VWALNDGGHFNIRIGEDVEADRPLPQQQAQAQEQGPEQGQAQAPGQPQAQAQEGQAQNNNNPEPDAAAAAEHTIRVSGASLGRLIGGALIIPTVSNRMGALLFHLSRWSPLLRRILAVRPPLRGLPPVAPPLWRYPLTSCHQWLELSRLGKIAMAVRFAFGAVWDGTRLWAECDPVW
jgi:hypothetical protein